MNMNRMIWVLPLALGLFTSGCGGKEHHRNKIVIPETPAAPLAPTGRTAVPFGNPKQNVDPSSGCAERHKKTCQNLEVEIARLKSERKQALEGKNEAEVQQKNLEISRKTEILALYAKGATPSDEEIRMIDNTYAKLQQKLDKQIEMKLPMNLYTAGELKTAEEVTKDFGDLYIKASPINNINGRPSTSAAVMDGRLPWSAYWYPKRDKSMFEGADAPLAKFDRLLQKVGREPQSVAWETGRYDPNDAEWEGLCDAWAMAAISTREPTSETTFKDITFSASDLKALTIKLFEGNSPKIYGKRYFGDSRSDGEFQDLRPEAFHRLVEKIVGQDKKALVLDTDPGPEVWTEPMVRMDWYITPDPDMKGAYLVKAWARFVVYRVGNDNSSTTEADKQIKKYEYRLYVDPDKTNASGAFKVLYGEWIGESRSSHPDMVFIPSANFTPINKGISDNKDVLLELLKEARVTP